MKRIIYIIIIGLFTLLQIIGVEKEGIRRIEIEWIFIIIFFIVWGMYILTYIPFKSYNNRNKIELPIIIGLNIIGIIFIIYNNQLFNKYLGIELYSYSLYYIILIKLTKELKNLTIIYFILNSLSSFFILLSFFLIYRITNILNIDYNNILVLNQFKDSSISTSFIIFFLFIGLLFKLGTFPYIFWYIKLYKQIGKEILLYLLIIPKFIFFSLLYNLLSYLTLSLNNQIYWLLILLLVISLITFFYALILGYNSLTFNNFFLFSSFFSISSFFLSLIGLLSNYSYYSLHELYFNILTNHSFINYFLLPFFLYLLQTFSLFFSFTSIRSSFLFTLLPSSFFNFFFFLLSLLSFFGLPLLSGFYLKLYLVYPLLNTWYPNYIILFSLISYFIYSFITYFFYLKLLIPSSTFFLNSSLSLLSPLKESNHIENINNYNYYINSLLSLFILSFSFYLPLIYPFFILS